MPEALRLEAEAWPRRAQNDLGSARKLVSGIDPFAATAAYHCQQAAEKALKAVIASTGAPIPKTHDLRVLVERCSRTDKTLDVIRDACEELTPFATEFRYPTDTPDPSPDEAADAIDVAVRIIAAVQASIDRRFPK